MGATLCIAVLVLPHPTLQPRQHAVTHLLSQVFISHYGGTGYQCESTDLLLPSYPNNSYLFQLDLRMFIN